MSEESGLDESSKLSCDYYVIILTLSSLLTVEETVAGIYKDYSLGAGSDSSERLKHQSLSSNTSTPSFASSGEDSNTKQLNIATGGSNNTSTSNINTLTTDDSQQQ